MLSFNTSEIPIQSGFKLPDSINAPVPDQTTQKSTQSTQKSRTGSKAQQAYDTFVEYTNTNKRIPSSKEFMAILQQEPYNMTAAGARTYYANIKKKYASMNETYSTVVMYELLIEQHLQTTDSNNRLLKYLIIH